jgi:hypothetical protein
MPGNRGQAHLERILSRVWPGTESTNGSRTFYPGGSKTSFYFPCAVLGMRKMRQMRHGPPPVPTSTRSMWRLFEAGYFLALEF